MKMYLKADLHIHTTWSDGKLTVKEVIDFYAAREFHCIAITDHANPSQTKMVNANNWDDYMADIKDHIPYAIECGLMLIPGVEFGNTNKYHIGALDIDKYINPTVGLDMVIAHIRSCGGLAIGNHPGPKHKVEDKNNHYLETLANLDKFDAVEIANGNQFFPEAIASEKPYVANTDLHIKGNIKSWKNLLEVDYPAISEVKNAILKRKNHIWRFVG